MIIIYKWLNGWDESIPEGWNKAFGKQMINELNDILVKYDYVNDYTILQVKEKYAMLRWYSGSIPEEMYPEYDEWLHKYEQLSVSTCVKCGEPATHVTEGWILPLCDNCGNK